MLRVSRVKTNLPPFDWVTPTLGTLLRLAFGPEKVFLQWLPSIAMTIGLAFYWHVKKKDWTWSEQLPLLVALGLVTSVYSWASDLVLLLPLLLQISLKMIQNLGKRDGFVSHSLHILELCRFRY